MKLRVEHLYPIEDLCRFRMTYDGFTWICDRDGEIVCSARPESISFLPAESFRLYVRLGLVARLVTDLDFRSLNLHIEINAAKHGLSKDLIPYLRRGLALTDYVPPINEGPPRAIIGTGVSQARVRREMRIMLAPGSHTKQEWRQVLQRDGWKCLRCGSTKRLTKDHVDPIAKGGSNYADNLQCLCASCNSWKGARRIDFRPAATLTQ